MKIRVYYEDTDAGGVVYHSNYLNFCERARSEMLYAKGKSPVVNGNHFVVSTLEAKFKHSAKLGDVLRVTAEIVELKKASVRMKQQVFKEDIVIFELELTLVLTNARGKITRLDKEAKALFSH